VFLLKCSFLHKSSYNHPIYTLKRLLLFIEAIVTVCDYSKFNANIFYFKLLPRIENGVRSFLIHFSFIHSCQKSLFFIRLYLFIEAPLGGYSVSASFRFSSLSRNCLLPDESSFWNSVLFTYANCRTFNVMFLLEKSNSELRCMKHLL
jgi:hypothetical protein